MLPGNSRAAIHRIRQKGSGALASGPFCSGGTALRKGRRGLGAALVSWSCRFGTPTKNEITPQCRWARSQAPIGRRIFEAGTGGSNLKGKVLFVRRYPPWAAGRSGGAPPCPHEREELQRNKNCHRGLKSDILTSSRGGRSSGNLLPSFGYPSCVGGESLIWTIFGTFPFTSDSAGILEIARPANGQKIRLEIVGGNDLLDVVGALEVHRQSAGLGEVHVDRPCN